MGFMESAVVIDIANKPLAEGAFIICSPCWMQTSLSLLLYKGSRALKAIDGTHEEKTQY